MHHYDTYLAAPAAALIVASLVGHQPAHAARPARWTL